MYAFFFCPVSTSWQTVEDSYRAPPIDRSILPTAPRAAREPNVDRSRLPRSPPYTAFLGNLPYDVSEESIKNFFRGLAVRKWHVLKKLLNMNTKERLSFSSHQTINTVNYQIPLAFCESIHCVVA